jgi:N-sulfoglucosamine sulfohydrolase
MQSFLRLIFAASLIFLLTTCVREEKKKPNILFILADDWSYPYATIYRDSSVITRNIDKLALNGIVFDNAFCTVPSSTPSRVALLTGCYPHRFGEAVNLTGRFDPKVNTYVKILRENGYGVYFDRKGWGPGDYAKMGYTENPAGEKIEFTKMLEKQPADKPFFFWFGTNDPHRPFDSVARQSSGIDASKIKVPDFLPDSPEVREDLAGYFSEIARLDREVGDLVEALRKTGRLENTVIIITGDNGMPFAHAKANLYDAGTRQPLIISNYPKATGGKHNSSFVNLIDLTPTFLDIAGITRKPDMDGTSLLPILNGEKTILNSEVYLERERHCLCRAAMNYNAGYPIRAIRTPEYLYIENLRPDRFPAGDESIPGTVSVFGDVDGGLSKMYIMDHRNDPSVKPFFDRGFGLRPAEELFKVADDPYDLNNLAQEPEYQQIKADLKARLEAHMKQTADPRVDGKGDEIDNYESTTHAWITRDGMTFWDK